MSKNKVRVLIPAYRIREKLRGKGEVEKAVNNLLGLVESDIEDAMENQLSFATTELDTYFEIPFMKNIDAQRKVYFYLTQSLTRANYTPRLLFIDKRADRQRVILYTTWKMKQEEQLNDYETRFLQSITLDAPPEPVPQLPSVMFGDVGKKQRLPQSNGFTEFLKKN
jgi:hypothetical protein